ncbi:prolyl-tRNA synthetase [Hokovirus HKV1]|uniref:proline--tRNA ligase n=1 Tax=Hokovirus HKV1 TaxID=1977638 RepID=A0A1V0SEQ8_9VIRU|nr:prolyl-tRNA synthetase [Hokovirus HKV1]
MNNKIIGITCDKETEFNKWYTELVIKCKLIAYTDVSGCYVLLPQSYHFWNEIKKMLETEFINMDIKNAYFPLFITQNNLKKEKDHVEGFSPEVAYVTKTGSHELEEENYLIVRPTSECCIYPVYKNLITTYKDLPLKYNQFCNVVRWEFKDTMPFIRSREFLWSEIHNCFTNMNDSIQDVNNIMNLYENIFFELLALPTIRGTKTNLEKFNGGISTSTLECIIPNNGKGIQACTSHYLGTNFSSVYDIVYRDNDNNFKNVHQTCHGITTRTIGISIMTHSDNKGLVVSPNIAEIQVIIIPIYPKNKELHDTIDKYCKKIYDKLGYFRCKIDNDKTHTVGYKFNHYELHGIPLRLEIGINEYNNNQIILHRRDNNIKTVCNIDNIKTFIKINIVNMHQNMYDKALTNVLNTIIFSNNVNDFCNNIKNNKVNICNWCNTDSCEKYIKENYQVKTLCILDTYFNKSLIEKVIHNDECMFCSNKNQVICLFGKTY